MDKKTLDPMLAHTLIQSVATASVEKISSPFVVSRLHSNHIEPHSGENKTITIEDLPAGHHRWDIPESASLTLTFLLNHPHSVTIDLYLTGPHAHVDVAGLVLTDTGTPTLTINQYHLAPDTTSKVLIKGILAGATRAQLRGLVTITDAAIRSTASHYHKVLLLDPSARCTAIPSFAVHHHQVRCNHGAAVGKLAIDQLAYLQSRGIPEPHARHLMTLGFAQEVTERATPEQQAIWHEKIALLTKGA